MCAFVPSLTALFSPAKRREMEQAQVSPHRRLLMGSNRLPGGEISDDEEERYLHTTHLCVGCAYTSPHVICAYVQLCVMMREGFFRIWPHFYW